MSVEIRVPPLGESVVEATVGQWTKSEGEAVRKDEILVELETDKITVEVAAPENGVLEKIEKREGETVGVNELLGRVERAEGAAAEGEEQGEEAEGGGQPAEVGAQTSPAARAIAGEHGIDLGSLQGSGPNARITKEDVRKAVEGEDGRTSTAAPPASAAARPDPERPPTSEPTPPPEPGRGDRETRQRMSRRRQTIAQRLLESQRTTASLTTFNEVDLSRIFEIRKRHQEAFVKRHELKLGFMSFFTKAAVGALKRFPFLNAEVQGDEIVLKHYFDIGIAVGTEKGLVVPVIRDADRKSFAEIERAIGELAKRARDGKLSIEELQGGTFSLTNGGIYGSMLSTPILNPPQVGILGMHNVVQRPVVVDGEIEIRPMMYLALTYDHRIVDGSDAVRFLVAVKEMVEDPDVMLLDG